jgi:formate/nitrite transporter
LSIKTPDIITNDIAVLGRSKAKMSFLKTIILSVLAGLYVSFGGMLMVFATSTPLSTFALTRLLGGLVFSIGLILIILAGGELFTGNTLMVIGFHGGHLNIKQILRNWSIVYIGNFFGALLALSLVYFSGIWQAANGTIGLNAVNIAANKAILGFMPAFIRGVGGNILVCLAVWLAASGDSTWDKITGVIFPITAFVALGFEHSVANMFLIPLGLVLKSFYHGSWASLTIIGFFRNLLPVTLGNILGGTAVGFVYWLTYNNKQANVTVTYLKRRFRKAS